MPKNQETIDITGFLALFNSIYSLLINNRRIERLLFIWGDPRPPLSVVQEWLPSLTSSQHSARSGRQAAGCWVPVAALRALVAHPLPRIGIYTAAALKSPLRPSQSPDGISTAILHRLNRRGIISRTKKLVKRFYGHHTKSAPQRDSRSLGGILCLLALAASVNFNSRPCAKGDLGGFFYAAAATLLPDWRRAADLIYQQPLIASRPPQLRHSKSPQISGGFCCNLGKIAHSRFCLL